METDDDRLIVTGKSFQCLDAATVKVVSLAKVESKNKWGGGDDLNLLVGAHKVKQVFGN